MNRFSTYLRAQKLAKALLLEAELKMKKNEPGAALVYLARALRESMVATNNLASLQFEGKKCRKKHFKCDHAVRQVTDGGVVCVAENKIPCKKFWPKRRTTEPAGV